MGKFLTDKPLPKYNLVRSLSDTELVKVLARTAEKLGYEKMLRKLRTLVRR